MIINESYSNQTKDKKLNESKYTAKEKEVLKLLQPEVIKSINGRGMSDSQSQKLYKQISNQTGFKDFDRMSELKFDIVNYYLDNFKPMPINENADSVLYYEDGVKYNKDDIAAQISINNEGESNAITGYYKLIPFFKSVGDQEAIDQIMEIISDEKNHQMKLTALQAKYDGGIPIPKD